MDSVSKQQKEPPKVYVTFEGCHGNQKADGYMIGVYLKLADAKQDIYARALADIDECHSYEHLSPNYDPEECCCSELRSEARKEILLGSMLNQKLYWDRRGISLLIIEAPIWRSPQMQTN